MTKANISKLRESRALRFKDNNAMEKFEVMEDKVKVIYDEASKVFNIYITDVITGPDEYTNVFETLLEARDDETIRFILSTPGGRLDTINKIRGLAQLTEAHTVAVVGDVASAGTILALSFDDIIVLPNIEFFIHNYSGGVGGKGHELYAHAAFLQKEMPKIFEDFYKDFLTPTEILEVLSGQDIYLNADEVNERWQNVMRVREAELDAILAEDKEAQKEYHLEALNKLGYNTKEEPAQTKAPSKKKPKDLIPK